MRFGDLYREASRNGLTKPRAIRGSGIRFINMGELFESDWIGDIQTDRVPVSDKEMDTALLEEGDLLFARQSLVREGAGKCSIVTRVTEPTTFDSHLIRVRLNQSKANSYFYQYFFRSPLSPMPGIVSQCAQAGIKGNDLAALDVPCPSLDKQNRIASVLMAYDNLIENNRRQIALLEEAAQRLYKEWFVDLHFPGYEEAEIDDGVPQGWQKKPLGKCLDKEIGGGWGQESSSHEFPEIGFVIRATDISDVESGNITTVPLRWHKTSNIRPRTLEAGDIIFEVSGGSREHGVGRSMLVTQEELDAFGKPVMCASFCKRIKPKQGLSLLLAECISYEYNTEGLRKFEKRSAGNIINYHWKPFLSEYSVLIPDGETLAAFEKQAGQIRDKKSRAAQAIRFAREARDRLLPKLMSSEIEVEG